MWPFRDKELTSTNLIVPLSYIRKGVTPEEALTRMNDKVQVFLVVPFVKSIVWSVQENPNLLMLKVSFRITNRDVKRSPYENRAQMMEWFTGLLAHQIENSGVVFDFLTKSSLKG